ncbi:MAG: fimbrial biogenesis outer membrane usher protein, partial [Sphingobacteriales bacterium]
MLLKALVIMPGLFVSQSALAEEVQFNDAFLPEGSQSLDLTLYEKGNPVLPGDYRADVAVNGKLMSRVDIQINADDDGSNPTVCFSRG